MFKEDLKGLAIVIAIWVLSMFLWDCIPQKETYTEQLEFDIQMLQEDLYVLEEELLNKQIEICELKKEKSEECNNLKKKKEQREEFKKRSLEELEKILQKSNNT